MSYDIGHRHSSYPLLLWLQFRLEAIASIQRLAWELPYAVGAALKRPKKKKKKRERERERERKQERNGKEKKMSNEHNQGKKKFRK